MYWHWRNGKCRLEQEKETTLFSLSPSHSRYLCFKYIHYLFADHSLARKLRAKWIEREKVKSKWRAQKRNDPSLRHLTAKERQQVSEEEEEEWEGIELPSPAPARTTDRASETAQRQKERQLAREAYAPATLHHHKSRFDRKRFQRGGVEKTLGGQPNMKLRMNALLDRIKRNMD